MANGGMSRSVVTALLIGCLVFGVLLGLIGTNRSSSSSSNLRDGNQANHVEQRAVEATKTLKATSAGNRKELDPSMLPRSFDKEAEGLEDAEAGEWNELFGAGEQFKAFNQLMDSDSDSDSDDPMKRPREMEMSFMFSYDMQTWD